MRTNIVDISLQRLDKAIMEYYVKTGDDASYIVMSSNTAEEVCKNLETLSNKVFSHNVTPKSNTKCRLYTYKGYKVAISDNLVYGEIDIV